MGTKERTLDETEQATWGKNPKLDPHVIGQGFGCASVLLGFGSYRRNHYRYAKTLDGMKL